MYRCVFGRGWRLLFSSGTPDWILKNVPLFALSKGRQFGRGWATTPPTPPLSTQRDRLFSTYSNAIESSRRNHPTFVSKVVWKQPFWLDMRPERHELLGCASDSSPRVISSQCAASPADRWERWDTSDWCLQIFSVTNELNWNGPRTLPSPATLLSLFDGCSDQ